MANYKKHKHLGRRALSLLMTLIMSFSLLQVSAFATGETLTEEQQANKAAQVVYGGETHVEGKEQVWTGTDSYTLAPDAAPFRLDIRPSGDTPISGYTSSNPAVCTVSEDGTVTPVGLGTCTISVRTESTVTYMSSTKEIKITVKKLEQTISAPDSLLLNPGGTASLNASCASGGKLTYATSDPAVAVVSEDGTVTLTARY